ncbi:flagellar biosynthesis anti-sigma factor FlgM [Candidatus Methylomicrobium oryzae]|jgi:negative regulator of flagellin synthesis FlgM|uniref:flagellar biosynthesis anti-sigma factor FlgM n=1 Tax=Candidatus Methylomicrobium oryzae TaxID=2802053 RepID=UPI0019226418|nr:flagellar biosynthesis anti-sigma factor FlgM [Methylomicrobium sp. RS1]MBL1265133.1 flagellar biosynthesis anti-sigma factor FlgM [Methylomicrobium sp. RS1]
MAIEPIAGRLSSLAPVKPVKKADADDQKQVSAKTVKHEDDTLASTVIRDFKKAVELSPAATLDVDRINAVKKALAEGKYQIDAEKIAQKMIEFEKLLPPD